jgi:hypothetical protein
MGIVAILIASSLEGLTQRAGANYGIDRILMGILRTEPGLRLQK